MEKKEKKVEIIKTPKKANHPPATVSLKKNVISMSIGIGNFFK